MIGRTLLLAALLMSPACGADRRRALGETLETYNDYVRWGRWDRAAAFLSRELRSGLLTRVSNHRDLRVTNYQISDLRWKGDRRAEVLVQIEWYSLSGARLRRSLLRQSWSQHEDRWQLRSQSRVGGDPFPLVDARR